MNLILINKYEHNNNGIFCPNERIVNHIKHTLQLQDGDFLKVGIINCQKGIGQLVVNETTNTIEIRLLPCYVQNIHDACELYNINIIKSEENEIRDHKYSKEINLTVNNTPKFIKLNSFDLQIWLTPYFENWTKYYTNINYHHTYNFDNNKLTKILKQICFEPVNFPRIDLIIALPRPKTIDKILRYISSLPIGKLDIFTATKSDLQYFNSKKMKLDNIKNNIYLGLEQSGNTFHPNVCIYHSINRALENYDSNNLYLIAHPYAINNIRPSNIASIDQLKSCSKVTLIFGPEGGFTDNEAVEIYNKLSQKAETVFLTLGKNILRCEVAIVYAVAQVLAILDIHNNIYTPTDYIVNPVIEYID